MFKALLIILSITFSFTCLAGEPEPFKAYNSKIAESSGRVNVIIDQTMKLALDHTNSRSVCKDGKIEDRKKVLKLLKR